MYLHAMHSPRVLAAVAKLPAPPLCQWMAAPLANPGAPLGCFAPGNLLSPDFAFDAELPGDWIFAWSGTLAGGLDEVSPMNWMRGPAMLREACQSLRPQLVRHGRRLLLVPHARHVLSDARSALTWWGEEVLEGAPLEADTRAPQGPRPFGLAFDPGALLEPSMLPDLHDHLRTLFAVFGPRSDAVLLRGVRMAADAERMEECPLAEGVMPLPVLRSLVAECVPAGTPLLIPGQGLAVAQQALAG
ncbi:MAG: hypothetical protein U0636_09790 [Phycisphaerales bacterium]